MTRFLTFWWPRLGGRFAAAGVVWLLLVALATAQAPQLLESEPAAGASVEQPPARVTATFAGSLAPESLIRVLDAQGRQVDAGDGGVDPADTGRATLAVNLPPLPGGSYTVLWHAVAAGGVPADGQFTFSVGDAPGGRGAMALPGWLGPVAAVLIAIGVALLVRRSTRRRAR